MTPIPPTPLSSRQLAALVGIAPRTLHAWIKQGLLPKAPFHARATTYSDEHLLRARAVRVLRGQGLTMSEVRRQLARADVATLTQLVGPATAAAETTAPPAVDYAHERWRRIVLEPGLEVHVREDASGALHRAAQDIHRYYGRPAAG